MIDHQTDSTDRVTDGPLLDFHDQLVAAIERQNSSTVTPLVPTRSRMRTRTTRVVAAVAAAAVLIVGVLVVSLSSHDSDVGADVTVLKQGDTVTVSIENDVDVAQIEQAMKDTGVKVTVIPTPTGPSRVNRFVGLSGPASTKLIGGDGTSSNKATFRRGSKVQIQLGVAANGRPYVVATVAWAPSEPLDGPSLAGQDLRTAGAELTARAQKSGARLDYRLDSTGQPTTPEPGDVIVNAQATAADQVLVMLHRG